MPKIQGMANDYAVIGYVVTCSCGASAWNSGTISVLCWERFWVEVDLKRRY